MREHSVKTRTHRLLLFSYGNIICRHLQIWDLLYEHTLIIHIWIIELDGCLFYHILDLSYCVIPILILMMVTVDHCSFTSLANIQPLFTLSTNTTHIRCGMACAINVGQT